MAKARHKFVAFDVETTRSEGPVVEPSDLQITCAATVTHESDVRLWHAPRIAQGESYGATMAPEHVKELFDYLYKLHEEGYQVISWNGLRFDWCVIATNLEDPGLYAKCAAVAMDHIDIMFDVFCVKGFPVGLDAAAGGLGVGGKLEGMSGSLAPDLWEQGGEQQELVLKYVRQDAILTAKVLLAIYRRGWFQWRARSGRVQQVALPMINGRLMVVNEALKLAEPDTSWMDTPMTRESFYMWTLPEDQRVAPEGAVTEIPVHMTQLTLDIAQRTPAALAAWFYSLLIAKESPQEARKIQEALVAHWPQPIGSADDIIQGLMAHGYQDRISV